VFGTNSDLIGKQFYRISPGGLAFSFKIKLELAPGKYVAGIAVLDSEFEGGEKLLGWWDHLIDFEIAPENQDFAGITQLDSAVYVKGSEADSGPPSNGS
jgi:hypothetical protein